jgi:hypothetical protein
LETGQVIPFYMIISLAMISRSLSAVNCRASVQLQLDH